jgi:hypothetical protein
MQEGLLRRAFQFGLAIRMEAGFINRAFQLEQADVDPEEH